MPMNHGQHVGGEVAIGVVAPLVDQCVGAVMAHQDGHTTRLLIDLGELLFEPRELLRADAALVVALGVVGVDQDQPHMLGVDDGVG